MDETLQLPIALRRTRRSKQTQCDRDHDRDRSLAPECMPVCTPKKSRGKKRVRFSDPGPAASATSEDELSTTGLTPMVQRTHLALPGTTPRRHSNPARLLHASNGSGIPDLDHTGSPFSGEVRFLPLRQVLDGRVKRRIRRNGLSEEMNSIYAERKRRAKETQAEIQRLKAELAERDDEIQRLHDETVVLDTDRVWDLEQQIEALKKELRSRSGAQQAPNSPTSPSYEWTMAARDPFSDDFMELDTENDSDDEEFGEATVAELMCSTPTRRMRNSFPTPPTTSPAPEEIQTPCPQQPTRCSHASIQTCLPDPDKQQLEEELASLQLEVCKLTTTLESYSALTSRLSEKLSPFTPGASSKEESSISHADIEAHLSSVLQTLSDRTAALAELNTSLGGLGFPGSDGFEVINSLRTGFRTARLELEYLTPGEITLPLSSAGAEVLDLILTRLRDLAKKNREADESIDEYHEIELSLRQQLNARVDAMDSLNKQLSDARASSREKDARIAELEVGVDRLKGAVRGYTRDLAELEALVERIEAELESSHAARESLQSAHDRAASQLAEKTSAVTALDSKLAAALEHTAALQAQLAALQTTHAESLAAHKAEVATLNRTHGRTLALRDARVAELRGEVERVSASLRAAHEAVAKLRVENGKLMRLNGELAHENVEIARCVEAEKKRAQEVVDGMRAELERVVRMGEGFLARNGGAAREGAVSDRGGSGVAGGDSISDNGVEGGSADGTCSARPVSEVSAGGLPAKDVASTGRGRKKRRYDSGLGFLDEEEVERDG
ncbi:Glycolipid 2-alpha-mannosyltransferase [Madurella fahalii]|uniref:Glycolipid 2-alpha-mannosyltransferase n=1 Tax=Madurella fahalii TaxID=1157608 RepID=A0ABQ0GJ90_9PEZI